MTHEFIETVLKNAGEDPDVLIDVVLLIRSEKDKPNLLFCLTGDPDYTIRDLEICDAGEHSKVFFSGQVRTEEELQNIVLEVLKQ